MKTKNSSFNLIFFYSRNSLDFVENFYYIFVEILESCNWIFTERKFYANFEGHGNWCQHGIRKILEMNKLLIKTFVFYILSPEKFSNNSRKLHIMVNKNMDIQTKYLKYFCIRKGI